MTAEYAAENENDDAPGPVEAPRARKQPDGVPVVLADGRVWRLARPGLAPVLNGVRDRLYDDTLLAGRVAMADVIQAAWVLLSANYDLDGEEIGRLLTGVDEKGLVDAVIEAVFGPEAPRRTYTTWILSAFYANSIDPAKVPAALIPDVMKQLVDTGRAIASADYVDSAEASRKRRKLLDGGD